MKELDSEVAGGSEDSQSVVARLLCALAKAAHGGLPTLVPQGLSLSASLLLALAAFITLGSQRIFALSLWWSVLSAFSCLAVMSFASSRPSFQCWPRSRTPSQWASPESWAPPVQVVAPFLLILARLWLLQLRQQPQYLQQRPRPVMRWPPLLGRALVLALLRRCPNVLHGHRVAAPVLPLACVVQSLSRSRDWSRAWPPRVAHRSRLPSCASHPSLMLSTLPQLVRSLPPTLLDPLHPLLRPPRPLVPRSPRPTLMTNGTHSLTHTASRHLLVAPRPAVAQPADAAGASRRARHKRRRRQRKAAKRSMWRDI